ncbi:hypothetical protein GINT2_000223 [Glugoides intestinalis]
MSTTCCTTQRLNLIIIGMPGSGKGTQSKKVAAAYNLVHITTGELLRLEAEKKTVTGKKINELLKSGKLLPDEIVNNLVKENITKDNFILDGYPRKLTQTEMLKDIDLVIYIFVSEEVAIKRILSRKEGRVDDNEEAAKRRFKAFEEETKPVIDYYKNKGILEVVEGSGTPEDVFSAVKGTIFKKFNI